MPFAGYTDFADCVAKNQDKDNPEAYCGSIKAQAENWQVKQDNPRESLEKILIRERLVPFVASFFAAEPGTSENGREYSEQVLREASPQYVGKPFLMDHDYRSSRQVQGKILRSSYENRYSPYTKEHHNGIWLDGMGLMDEDLYKKMEGDSKKGIPPLIRGVSIGGDGQGVPTQHGTIQVKSFKPMELSGTAFPGIPSAHVAVLSEISESIKAGGYKPSIDLTSAKVKDISLSQQGVQNMPTLAEAVQEAANNAGLNKELPRSPLRRVSHDGRTVAFPTGVRVSAPRYNDPPPAPVAPEPKTQEVTPTKFNPPQVPDIVDNPPLPQAGILPAHPTGVSTEPNAELFKQANDQREQLTRSQDELKKQMTGIEIALAKIEADLKKLGEQGPTRGMAQSLTAGPHEPPGGIPAPVPDLSQGKDAPPGVLPPNPWLQQSSDPAAGKPEFDNTVQSRPLENPNLEAVPTHPGFAPRSRSPTLPAGIMQRYGAEGRLVQTVTVSGLTIPRPVPQQVGQQRYHARTEDVMRNAEKHLEQVKKERPNASLNDIVREAWYRGMNEITGKSRTANKPGLG